MRNLQRKVSRRVRHRDIPASACHPALRDRKFYGQHRQTGNRTQGTGNAEDRGRAPIFSLRLAADLYVALSAKLDQGRQRPVVHLDFIEQVTLVELSRHHSLTTKVKSHSGSAKFLD